MKAKQSIPGVSRADRISEEGLSRLEKQLESGAKVSIIVFEQWVRRYGILVKPILMKFNRWDEHLESILASVSDQ